MAEVIADVRELRELPIAAGDRVILSGTVYTARDAAHKRICALLDQGEPPPFPLELSLIHI